MRHQICGRREQTHHMLENEKKTLEGITATHYKELFTEECLSGHLMKIYTTHKIYSDTPHINKNKLAPNLHLYWI